MSKSSSDNNLSKNQTTTRDSSTNKSQKPQPPQQLMINLHGQGGDDFHIVTQNNFTPASPSAAYYNQQIIQMNPG